MQQFNLFSILPDIKPKLNDSVYDKDLNIGKIVDIGNYGYLIVFKDCKSLVSFQNFRFFFKVVS